MGDAAPPLRQISVLADRSRFRSERDYHFVLATDLGYINDSDYKKLNPRVVEVRRKRTTLLRKVDADRRGD